MANFLKSLMRSVGLLNIVEFLNEVMEEIVILVNGAARDLPLPITRKQEWPL